LFRSNAVPDERAAAAGGSRRGRTGGVRPRSVLAATAQADGGKQAGGAAEEGEAGGLGDGDDLDRIKDALGHASSNLTHGGEVKIRIVGSDRDSELHVIAGGGIVRVEDPAGGLVGCVAGIGDRLGTIGAEVKPAGGAGRGRIEINGIFGLAVVGVSAGDVDVVGSVVQPRNLYADGTRVGEGG